MDFDFIEKRQVNGISYKLYRATFCRGYFVISAQSKNEFSCGSICSSAEGAKHLLDEIASSETEVHTLVDLLRDFQMSEAMEGA